MSSLHVAHADSVIGALRSAAHPRTASGAHPVQGIRFITISREAGIGARPMSHALAARLNELQPGSPAWTAWDQELVDRVSSEHGIPRELVESLEDASHPWLGEFLNSLSTKQQYSDFAVYRRVALTIRAVAGMGRAILVGRGSRFITARMHGGLHIRLVAPLEVRIKQFAARNSVDSQQAAARVQEIQSNREAFFHRYWPNESLSPHAFSLTLNAAELSEAQLVECVAAVVTAGK